MKLIKSKKGISFLLIVAIAAISAVGAFAYWTTTGAGTGSAANAASNGEIVLTASWAADALYPGGDEVVSFTANNAGPSNLYVGTVTSVVSTDDVDCLASDFTVAPVAQGQIIEPGTEDLDDDGLIVFANSALNQDACKGATVTLTLSSN